MRDIAYYNGVIGPIDEVKAPITDRGLYFGDGVYEAAIVRNGRIFALGDHLDRFFRSLSMLEITPPMSREELSAVFYDLASRVDGGSDYTLYWQTTRGIAHRAHVFPQGVPSTLMAFIEPSGLDRTDKPVRLLTCEDTRFFHCNIKTLNLVPNVMAAQRAKQAGCQEVVFHRGDRVTEGSHAAIAMLRDGAFCVPPADELVLPSITRQHCLNLCQSLGIPTMVAPFTLGELLAADEILVLSTGAHCVSACEIDGKPVGGKAADLLQRLQQAYKDLFESEVGKRD